MKKNMTPEKEQEYLNKLSEALTLGSAILKNGGTSLDAVTKTIMVMENSPLFNALHCRKLKQLIFIAIL